LRNCLIADGPWRAEIFGLGGAWQSVPLVARLEQSLGYNPIRLAAYESATGARQNSHTMERARPPGFTRYDDDLPRRLGIRVVATGEALADPAALGLSPGQRMAGAWFYANTTALPRVMAEPGVATLLHRTTTSVRIAVTLPVAGRLVLHDLYYPAWTATADRRPLPVERYGGLFRSVRLPAGQHIVEFEYRPMRPGHVLDLLFSIGRR
jgi:hypothetical protein